MGGPSISSFMNDQSIKNKYLRQYCLIENRLDKRSEDQQNHYLAMIVFKWDDMDLGPRSRHHWHSNCGSGSRRGDQTKETKRMCGWQCTHGTIVYIFQTTQINDSFSILGWNIDSTVRICRWHSGNVSDGFWPSPPWKPDFRLITRFFNGGSGVLTLDTSDSSSYGCVLRLTGPSSNFEWVEFW